MEQWVATKAFQPFNHRVLPGFYGTGGHNSLSPFFTGDYLAIETLSLLREGFKVLDADQYVLYMGLDYDEALRVKEDYDATNHREAICGYIVIFDGKPSDYSDYYKALVDTEEYNKKIIKENKEIRKLRLVGGDKLPHKEEAKIINKYRNEGRVAKIIRAPLFLKDHEFVVDNDDNGRFFIKSGNDYSNRVLLFVSEKFFNLDRVQVDSDGLLILRDRHEIGQNIVSLDIIVMLDVNQKIIFSSKNEKIEYRWDGNNKEVVKTSTKIQS